MLKEHHYSAGYGKSTELSDVRYLSNQFERQSRKNERGEDVKGANAVPVWQRSTWVAKDSGDYLVDKSNPKKCRRNCCDCFRIEEQQ